MQNKEIGIRIAVKKTEGGYVAYLVASDKIIEGLFAYGVMPAHNATSGWGALAKMVENWKRAGFMD